MLDEVKAGSEYFDEAFFAYREDADLAWRAQWMGWRCLYVPEAQGHHVRRVLPERRAELPAEINMHSFKNRFLLRIKNMDAGTYVLNPGKFDENGLLVCMDSVKPLIGDRALIEFPSDFQAIKKTKSDLARAWREQIRSICEGAFARGYSVIDFVYEAGPPARSFYLLHQIESTENTLNA